MDYKIQNEIFIKKFNFNKYNFYEPVFFADGIGFSVKKKLRDNDQNVTLLKFYISDEIFNNVNIKKKPIYITATYGKNTESGVVMRSVRKNKEPVDMESRDEYFYDRETGKIYKKNKEISADDFLNRVYNIHTKTTKPIRVFFLRMELVFWWIVLKAFFDVISNLFYFALLVISGDKYTYEYALREETLNGRVIKSGIKNKVIENTTNENLKESEKIDFFGLKVRYWPIAFYSVLHFCFYWFAVYTSYYPVDIIRVFENNFLTVLYVFLSFWFIEILVPHLLKLAIKQFSMFSEKCLYKKISL